MTAGQIRLPVVYMAVMGAGRSSAAQHSDVPYPAFMNLGGVKVVVPSTSADAKGLLKAAIRDDNPVIFLQPARRGGELGEVPDGEHLVPLGTADTKRTGSDVTIVAIGAMVRHALRAADLLQQETISAEVIDPRTLFPLDEEAILASVRKTGRLVVVEEDNRTGGWAADIAAIVAEEAFFWLDAPIKRVSAPDTPAPFAPVMEHFYVPSAERVVQAVKSLF
jgi:pyruvate dehydrogenase E1 component beta subunit